MFSNEKRVRSLKNHVLPIQTPPEKLDDMVKKLAELAQKKKEKKQQKSENQKKKLKETPAA